LLTLKVTRMFSVESLAYLLRPIFLRHLRQCARNTNFMRLMWVVVMTNI